MVSSIARADSIRSATPASVERNILVVLTVMQFLHILDFVILMPLGPQLMRIFSVSPTEFGLLVSSYTFSAAISSLAIASFVDRFDRRTVLLLVFSGFLVGTLFCALANSYEVLLSARILSGAFGGLMNGLIMSMIGDVFPEERRGRATGIIMSSFSIASILGVPIGLLLTSLVSWHVPFYLIVLIGLILIPFAIRFLPQLRAHIDATRMKPWNQIIELLRVPFHWFVFLFTFAIMMTVFLIIPYLSPYLVSNAGVPEDRLWMVYFTGGIFTFFSSRYIGRLSDQYGKKKIYSWLAVLAILPLILVTNMEQFPFVAVIASTTLFIIIVSGRTVPAMAMIAGSVRSGIRGGFMSLNSSVQQVSSGIASLVAGLLLATDASGKLLHFNEVGFLAAATSVISLFVARRFQGR